MYTPTHQRVIKPSLNMAVNCHLLFLTLCLFFVTANLKSRTAIHPFVCYKNFRFDPINAFISIVKDKVIFEIPGDQLRGAVLQDMGSKYHYQFLPYEQCLFMGNGVVAAPMANMKDYIDKYTGMYSFSGSLGIPTELDNNELHDWILESRIFTRALLNRYLSFIVTADINANPVKVARVLQILKAQHVDRPDYKLTSGSLEKPMFVGQVKY